MVIDGQTDRGLRTFIICENHGKFRGKMGIPASRMINGFIDREGAYIDGLCTALDVVD